MSRPAERLWVALLLAGCGGSSGAPPPGDPVDGGLAGDAAADGTSADAVVEATAFCDPYAAAWCERFAVCSPSLLLSVYGDADRCRERRRLDCRVDATRPGTGFD